MEKKVESKVENKVNIKKYNIIKIALVIFIISTLALGGYIVYDKVIINLDKKTQENDKKDGNNVQKEQSKEVSLEDKEIDALMQTIDYLSSLDSHYDTNLSVEDLTNQTVLGVAISISPISGGPLYDYWYDLSVLNDTSNKYFNRDIVTEDYICSFDNTALYKYDKDSKRYVENEDHLGHGGNNTEIINLYDSSSKKENIYTVSVKKAFGENDYGLSRNFYTTYKDAFTSSGEPAYRVEEAEYIDFTEAYEKAAKENVEKLNTYTYTFEKVGANYIFKSVVRK